jgi:hypothetical protein
VLAKYYLRFTVSGFVIFLLIAGGVVNPLGLVIGLSVVVVSIILATIREVKKIILGCGPEGLQSSRNAAKLGHGTLMGVEIRSAGQTPNPLR